MTIIQRNYGTAERIAQAAKDALHFSDLEHFPSANPADFTAERWLMKED